MSATIPAFGSRLLRPFGLIALLVVGALLSWNTTSPAQQGAVTERALTGVPTVVEVAVPTAMRAAPVPATVILPSTYSAQEDRVFPVLYLLHGAGGDHREWARATSIEELAEELEIVVVCPDGGRTSWYFDSPIDPGYQYEAFVSSELVKYVDETYRTRRDRESRAIAGLSMGGHGALFLAIRHSDVFGTAVAMSGGVDIRPFPRNWDIAKRIGTIEEAPERWEELTVINQARSLEPGRLAISLDCGTDDFFLPANRALHAQLLAAKVPHDYAERPGGHSWDYWARCIRYPGAGALCSPASKQEPPMTETPNQDPFQLYQRGMQLVQQGEIDQALDVAQALEERRFTGCFEIEYQANLAQGYEADALAALERGAQLVPDAWYLWKLIGIHHSDREAWPEARAALGQALACPSADPSDIHCNLAVVESRAGCAAAAREHLEQVSEPNAVAFAKTIEIDLLMTEQRFDDAVREARAWLEANEEADRALQAEVRAKIAEAHWLGGKDARLAEAELAKAILLDNANARLARIRREIRGERSADAKMWRLLVQGVVHGMGADAKLGFYTTYFVVAENESQALRFVEPFEPAEYHSELKIAEAEVVQPAGDALLGVYEKRGGYAAFPLE